jgi:hypothetical protein
MCRGTVLRILALTGDEETKVEAKKLFVKHLDQTDLLPADLRSAVYVAVLIDADENLLKKFIEMHDASDLQEEQVRIATALSAVKSSDLLKKVLEFSMSVCQ